MTSDGEQEVRNFQARMDDLREQSWKIEEFDRGLIWQLQQVFNVQEPMLGMIAELKREWEGMSTKARMRQSRDEGELREIAGRARQPLSDAAEDLYRRIKEAGVDRLVELEDMLAGEAIFNTYAPAPPAVIVSHAYFKSKYTHKGKTIPPSEKTLLTYEKLVNEGSIGVLVNMAKMLKEHGFNYNTQHYANFRDATGKDFVKIGSTNDFSMKKWVPNYHNEFAIRCFPDDLPPGTPDSAFLWTSETPEPVGQTSSDPQPIGA